MLGNFNVNHDNKTVGYDLSVQIPFIGSVVLTKEQVDKLIAKLEETKQPAVRFDITLDGLHLKELAFEELDSTIQKIETAKNDLVELKEKTL